MLKIVENLWAVRALTRTPLGEFTALPKDPLVGGEEGGLLLPPQEPQPRLGLRLQFSGLIRQSPQNFPSNALGSG